MTKLEREHMYSQLTPEMELCINCTHFHRHYHENGRPFDSGHCSFPRSKLKRAYDTCDRFDNKNGG